MHQSHARRALHVVIYCVSVHDCVSPLKAETRHMMWLAAHRSRRHVCCVKPGVVQILTWAVDDSAARMCARATSLTSTFMLVNDVGKTIVPSAKPCNHADSRSRQRGQNLMPCASNEACEKHVNVCTMKGCNQQQQCGTLQSIVTADSAKEAICEHRPRCTMAFLAVVHLLPASLHLSALCLLLFGCTYSCAMCQTR